MRKQQNDYYSEFGYYIHRVASLLDKRGDEQFRSRFGISLRQFLLLRLVEAADGAPSQQLIAERLGIAKSAVSRHVDIAKQKSWIEVRTSGVSRRENELELTATGKQLLVSCKKFIKTSEQEGFGALPDADIEATLRTLRALHAKLSS
ncbi:MAG TPA: MarR family winged helix-turn-helix transcriptional regulator [Candidatus Saccharimonadales bacterium]